MHVDMFPFPVDVFPYPLSPHFKVGGKFWERPTIITKLTPNFEMGGGGGETSEF